MLPRYPFALFFLLCFAMASSCSRNTRAVQQSSARVKASVSSQQNAGRNLDELSKKSAEAAKSEQIDDSTDKEIQAYIERERANIEAHIRRLETANQTLEEYKAGTSNSREKELVEAANQAAGEASKSLRILEEKTRVIVDFLDSETFSKAEVGALFDPGEYVLPAARTKRGKQMFTPIVQKLYVFAQKYESTFRSLKGDIIVTGYSDGTRIDPGSNLHRTLAPIARSKYNIDDPTSTDLNLVLSELRAEAVSELINSILTEEESKRSNSGIRIEVRTLGRGESIPPGVSQSAAINDSRRRVVTFYWVVLPEL